METSSQCNSNGFIPLACKIHKTLCTSSFVQFTMGVTIFNVTSQKILRIDGPKIFRNNEDLNLLSFTFYRLKKDGKLFKLLANYSYFWDSPRITFYTFIFIAGIFRIYLTRKCMDRWPHYVHDILKLIYMVHLKIFLWVLCVYIFHDFVQFSRVIVIFNFLHFICTVQFYGNFRFFFS